MKVPNNILMSARIHQHFFALCVALKKAHLFSSRQWQCFFPKFKHRSKKLISFLARSWTLFSKEMKLLFLSVALVLKALLHRGRDSLVQLLRKLSERFLQYACQAYNKTSMLLLQLRRKLHAIMFPYAQTLRDKLHQRFSQTNKPALFAISSTAITVFVFILGYTLGQSHQSNVMFEGWQTQFVEAYQKGTTRNEAEIHLMGSKVALMETQIMRLEALGEYFSSAYNINTDDIDFNSRPGLGGENMQGTAPQAQEVREMLGQLGNRFSAIEVELAVLTDLVGHQSWQKEMLPDGLPVNKGWISSKYGYRMSPFSGRREFHSGIDIAGRHGMPIHAVAAGVIKRSRYYKDYGHFVEVEHANGYMTRYGHNQVNLVVPGELVKQGDVIALMGSTGRSTGPHLHFEVLKQGRKINPKQYLGH